MNPTDVHSLETTLQPPPPLVNPTLIEPDERHALIGSDPATSSRAVRIARPEDLNFINDLYKKHTTALGFIPLQGVETYIRWRSVILGTENDDPAGYLLLRHDSRDTPGCTLIHQACVQYDARHRQIGLAMVKRAQTQGAQHGNAMMQLWCRSDLEANEFWRVAGFEAIGLRLGGKRRKTPNILWRQAIRRGTNLKGYVSTRRRNECGAPVIISDPASTNIILAACRSGTVSQLLKDVAHHASAVPDDIDDVPLLPEPTTHLESSSLTMCDRRAHVAGNRRPPPSDQISAIE